MVRLICRDAEGAKQHAALLERAGLRVNASPPLPTGLTKHLSETGTAAIVIDLDRLPSFGREIAVMVRNSKRTRHIAIVFAGGLAEKVERIRAELPDATFCAWKNAATSVKKAIRNPVAEPVNPLSHMERYAGVSLATKLGIKPGFRVAILASDVASAAGLEEQLRDSVPDAVVVAKLSRDVNLALCFARSLAEVEAAFDVARTRLADDRSIWVISPKQSGRLKSDFNQNDVRDAGLRAGWVDYKVCSVDADWSGLKFSRRDSPSRR